MPKAEKAENQPNSHTEGSAAGTSGPQHEEQQNRERCKEGNLAKGGGGVEMLSPSPILRQTLSAADSIQVTR